MPFKNENPGALAGATEVNVENNVLYNRRISSTFQVEFLKWMHRIALDVSLPLQASRVAAHIAFTHCRGSGRACLIALRNCPLAGGAA